jgi:Tfp pilus assembly protein PilF
LTRDIENANDVDAWIGLGELSFVLRDQARLRTAANRVVALAPDRPDGHVLRALQMRRAGDLAGATQSLRAALKIREDAQTLMLLGMVQRDLNQMDASRQTFAAAARLDPSNQVAADLAASTSGTVITGFPTGE